MQIINVEPHSPEWRALRHEDLTASEIGAFFDPRAYKSEFQLWHEKKMEEPPKEISPEDDSFIRAEHGKFIEPFIARMFHIKHGVELENFKGYVRHDSIERFACSPDYQHPVLTEEEAKNDIYHMVRNADGKPITPEDGPGMVELKAVNLLSFHDNYTDGEPPIRFIAQLQGQLECTGYKWGMVVSLVDNSFIDVAVYRRDERVIEIMRKSVVNFWDSQEKNIEPEPTGKASDEMLLRTLYPKLYKEAPVDMSDSERLFEVCGDFSEKRQQRLALEKEEDKLKNIISSIVGANAITTCHAFKVTKAIRDNAAKFSAEDNETGYKEIMPVDSLAKNDPYLEIALDMEERGNKTRTREGKKYEYKAASQTFSLNVKEEANE